MSEERLKLIRAKAWQTRRQQYGQKGHNSSYSRRGIVVRVPEKCLMLIARLHMEGILSEGQACSALEMHRIEFRKYCDQVPA